ncbi:MAG: family 65 glycosyl hydrolase domain-containing protein [Saprospiraceae bacterium]|nr:family 65 glycosyl hydrolase domain-containing protein [Saprospiraceae bacterium]
MKDYIVEHKWKIIEESYNSDYNQITESLMSLGNGKMGQRANYEESFSGPSLQGSYIAGVYYPDKTRVGWWKNGYPEYFAKVLNSVNWIGIDVKVGNEQLDLAKAKTIHSFYRELDMQKGYLYRKMEVTLNNNARLIIESTRINSMANDELGAISYSVKSVNYDGPLTLSPYLDFDVANEDSNYDEKFWLSEEAIANSNECYVSCTTKKTEFVVGAAMTNNFFLNDEKINSTIEYKTKDKKAIATTVFNIASGDTLTIEKYAGLTSSMHYSNSDIKRNAIQIANTAAQYSFSHHLDRHTEAWSHIWETCDIKIKGDVAAQQGIRFNIFQLYQTYTGQDDRLNIGPKGFTGEKYGGSTYWDTEAYCLPFYLSTTNTEVGKNLLIYRYKQLDKAIENAEKLGFTCGAALYPMVTMTGEECHNEWEITFEEIHRNGAIAYAIFDYIRYTGDHSYLEEYGIEVLVAIARFWAQRVNWSSKREKYVMLGVTGPNEYENNVNNNWYTNYIACWCLKYADESLVYVKETNPSRYIEIIKKIDFVEGELSKWKDIVANMYYPEDEDLGIFLQQDNYLDKEQITVDQLDKKHRPINQKWSWDRILRSCFIKQADVLQGMYFFEEDFSLEEHMNNFRFYEPRTVHESSLSPCVHGILASKLELHDKAYEMYLRTSRLDLDDYNNDTEDGCHITSMAGTWLSIVKGFGGQRVQENKLSFTTSIPKKWEELRFKIKFRANLFEVIIGQDKTEILNLEGPASELYLNGQLITTKSLATISTLN